MMTVHYLTDEIDPVLLRGARDHLVPFMKKGRILNLGLGYGVWDEFLNTLPDEVFSLDISAELVTQFETRFPNITYVVSDVYDYRPEKNFDTIVAAHFLEHLDEPVRFLKLTQSWLNPGGAMILVVPNAESIHRRIGKQLGMLKELTELNDMDRKVGHKRVYTLRTLQEHLTQSGLTIIQANGTTFKPLSNAQLAQLPRDYVQACARIHDEIGSSAAQLYAVVTA